MLLFSRQGNKQHSPQIANQLHLGAGGLQGQDVVLVEHGHGLQSVVVPGILTGVFIGNGVYRDLHHAGLAGQVLGPDGNAVEGVGNRQRPGQGLKGRRRLTFEIEMGRSIAPAERKGGGIAGHRRSRAIG